MNRSEITEKLNTIFPTVFNKPGLSITESLTASDVDGWDSLTHMILISEVEKSFGITFKLKELNKMKNVGDMIEIIASKL
ncbi:acyl carrier protein [Flavobacterium selenitireducens]|uniref:acyl carrier protein n=1 Tax=Flavobacterium selenitireducens TaxID=2722704 RepID=UPI00168BB10F|nr:acyl carrier protein [Flavobacterium selenitireducens]MBD3581389.1 acyl carrier protein [Flavobacterium selenitireducens]